MKLERIEVFPVAAPLAEPIGWSRRWAERRQALLVRITDSDGAFGWGEAHGAASDAPALAACAALAVGQDADAIEALSGALRRAAARAGEAARRAYGALEIALHDLWGRRAARPAYARLGTALRERVAVYASGLYYAPVGGLERLRAEAHQHVSDGFAALKMKIGGLPAEEDAARVAAVRDAIGEDVRLMVDANGAYDPASAVAIARRLAGYGLAWLEEPCDPFDDEANLRVRREAGIPLAGGEKLWTRRAFAERLAQRVFDVAQPDPCRVGGCGELAAVAELAQRHGVALAPHAWGTQLGLAAALHVLATRPRACLLELDRTPNPLRDEITLPAFAVRAGELEVPAAPGLGVEVCEDALARFLQGPPLVAR